MFSVLFLCINVNLTKFKEACKSKVRLRVKITNTRYKSHKFSKERKVNTFKFGFSAA